MFTAEGNWSAKLSKKHYDFRWNCSQFKR